MSNPSMTDSFGPFRTALSHRYRVEGEIGRGGMGIVYRARDLLLERDVALKVLRPEISALLGSDRFLREIRIEAALQHPNILPVLDSGEAGGISYCVLPFVVGETLRQRLADGPLPINEAIRIATDLGQALEYAHQAGFVHRDLKPENVLLSGGRTLLLDFGIARAIAIAAGDRLTSEGIAIGTPAYMSPEQASGETRLDGRADIYSLGVLLFEMLAGEPPFAGQTPQAVLARHLVETAPPVSALRPSVDPGLDRVITRALAKVPIDRFATATEFLEALTHHAEFVAPDPLPRKRRWPGLVVAGLVLTGAVLAGRRWLMDPPLDAARVVVFPVLDRRSESAMLSFDTEVPYAIELALEHSAPLRWVHGWNYLDEAVRRDPLSLTGSRMQRLARRQGARYFIDGAVQRSPAGTQLVLQLHDAKADSTIATEAASLGGTGVPDLPALAVQAVSKLLLRWLAPGRHGALAALASRRPGAVALQVQGEQEYRRARFTAALGLFERSVALDSTWGYAAIKAAQAASWLNRRGQALQFVKVALRHTESLPRQYTEFARGLEAYLEGRSDDAVRFLRQSVDLAPDWEEAHMALGEVYYHLLPASRDPQGEARVAFEAALNADSSFGPAARHLAEIAFREGDLVRGEVLLNQMRVEQADSETTRTLTLMRDCLRGRSTTSAWETLAGYDPLSISGAARQLGAGAAQPVCAERLYRVLLGVAGLPEAYAWGAVIGLQGLLLSTGRTDQLLQLLDSALQGGAGAVRFLYLLEAGEAAGLTPRASATAAFAREHYGEFYEGAAPLTRWALSAWHTTRRDSGVVGRISRDQARNVETGDRRGLLIRDAVAAHAAVARGDTTRAIALLRALRSNAPVDMLTGDLFESLAFERLQLGELLLATGRYQEAHDAVMAFDHAEVAFTPFVARSLVIRHQAMAALGDARAAEYQRRLTKLGRADLLGPRR